MHQSFVDTNINLLPLDVEWQHLQVTDTSLTAFSQIHGLTRISTSQVIAGTMMEPTSTGALSNSINLKSSTANSKFSFQ